MPLDRVKLLKLRENINAYVRKMEAEDPVKVVGEVTAQKIDDLGQLIEAARPEDRTDELIEAITSLKFPEIKDRTDEVVKAISTIRFPETFPDHISVDNFPPQKIPQPVTNIKSTLVADNTGLLQQILNAISGGAVTNTIQQAYGETPVAVATETVLATMVTTQKCRLKYVYGQGEADGLFNLYVDGSRIWQARNAWTERNVRDAIEYDAPAGKTVELKVINLNDLTWPYSGGFYGYLI